MSAADPPRLSSAAGVNINLESVISMMTMHGPLQLGISMSNASRPPPTTPSRAASPGPVGHRS